jgi:hypothetical protein
MRHTFQVPLAAIFLSLDLVLSAGTRLFAAEPAKPSTAKPSATAAPPASSSAAAKPAPALDLSNLTLRAFISPGDAKPAAQKAPTTLDKLKTLGSLLSRALDVTADIFSGNEGNLLSRNKTTLLSGNAPKILSENTTPILSGNNTKLLSENTTPIFSGNTFSMFSNIKVEIHINNSAGAMGQPPQGPATAPSASFVPTRAYGGTTPTPSYQVPGATYPPPGAATYPPPSAGAGSPSPH